MLFILAGRPRHVLTHWGLVLVAVTAAAGCSAFPEDSPAHTRPGLGVVRIAHTWGDEGSPFASTFRSALTQKMPGTEIVVLSSAVGATNLLMLHRNDMDAVSTYADIAYMASIGQLPEIEEAFDGIRAIAALPVRTLQIVVGPHSAIRSMSDFRGRRVSLGPPGTGIAITAGLLLSAFGIERSDLHVEQLAFDEAVSRLMSGEIDAAFWGGAIPSAGIQTLAARGARILQVLGPEIERVRAEYPFLRATIIPSGTYVGIDEPIHTVGVDRIFVCRADLDEDVVYHLTEAFLKAVVAGAAGDGSVLRGFNLSRAAATPLALHPGAARYYREIEMRR